MDDRRGGTATRVDEARCPICSGQVRTEFTKMHDDRYGYPESFDIHKCLACGHMRLVHAFSPPELSALYTNYYPRRNFDVAAHRIPAESSGLASWLSGERCAAFRWVPRGVRVLDIGCGLCETLGYHLSRGCDAYGVEADENVRRVAEHFGYKVRVGLFDSGAFDPDFFDYVTLDQVIEHVEDPYAVITGIARVLKPGGNVIISTPNAGGWGARIFRRTWINWHVPYHLHQFSRRSMQIVAAKAGLQLIGAKTLTHSDWLFFQLVHLLAKPAPGSRHPFWMEERWPDRRQVFAHRVASRLLRVSGILQLATRLFDALGLGDNQLFFLRKPQMAGGK